MRRKRRRTGRRNELKGLHNVIPLLRIVFKRRTRLLVIFDPENLVHRLSGATSFNVSACYARLQ